MGANPIDGSAAMSHKSYPLTCREEVCRGAHGANSIAQKTREVQMRNTKLWEKGQGPNLPKRYQARSHSGSAHSKLTLSTVPLLAELI